MFSITIYIRQTSGTNEEQHKWDEIVSQGMSRLFYRFRYLHHLIISAATTRYLRIIDKALPAKLKFDNFVILTGHFGITHRWASGKYLRYILLYKCYWITSLKWFRTFALDILKKQTPNQIIVWAHYCDEKIGERWIPWLIDKTVIANIL